MFRVYRRSAAFAAAGGRHGVDGFSAGLGISAVAVRRRSGRQPPLRLRRLPDQHREADRATKSRVGHLRPAQSNVSGGSVHGYAYYIGVVIG